MSAARKETKTGAAVRTWTEKQVDRASYFTAVRFAGAGGQRQKIDNIATLDEAREIARTQFTRGGRPVMLYAVTPDRMSVHVENVEAQGVAHDDAPDWAKRDAHTAKGGYTFGS